MKNCIPLKLHEYPDTFERERTNKVVVLRHKTSSESRQEFRLGIRPWKRRTRPSRKKNGEGKEELQKGNRSLGSNRGRSIKSRRRRVQEANAACTGGFLSDFEWVDPNSRNLLACATDRLILGLVSPSVQLLPAERTTASRVSRG